MWHDRNTGHPTMVVILWLAATATGTRAVDQVTRDSDGVTIRGEFASLDPTQVVIRRTNGRTETVSTDDIRDIRFDREPSGLQAARSNVRSGGLESALERLKSLQSARSVDDERVTADIEYLIARCQALGARVNPSAAPEAITALEQFRTRHRSSFRLLEAILLQAELMAAEGDDNSALRRLQQVRDSSVVGFQLRAGVATGCLLLGTGKTEEALTAFDDVTQRSQGRPASLTTHFDARIGRARCFRQQSRLDEAIKTLDAVIEEAPEEQSGILAKAWNLKGDCLRAKGSSRAAQLAYLHVDILYAGESAQHAEALFQLASLWKSSGHPDRSQDASDRLRRDYAGSPWIDQLPN